MATYDQIRAWVKAHHGFVPKTCWIAHVKELNGLGPRVAHNRLGRERAVPCPANKRHALEQALGHFGMLPSRQ
jgi:hypothetical protein